MNYPYRGVFLTKQIVSPLTTWYCANGTWLRVVNGLHPAWIMPPAVAATPLSGFRINIMRCESAFFFAPTYSSDGNPLVKWVADFSLTACIALIACLFFLVIGFTQAIPLARLTDCAPSNPELDGAHKSYQRHAEGNRCTRTYTFPDWIFMLAQVVISCVCIALLLWMPNSWQRVWSGNPLIEFQVQIDLSICFVRSTSVSLMRCVAAGQFHAKNEWYAYPRRVLRTGCSISSCHRPAIHCRAGATLQPEMRPKAPQTKLWAPRA
jgi:hypothetical protein